ncbi:hypothetical protein [Sporosarcina limicola]|uniref:Uncharacterized protein n=1 Tax=Sporosarcina limicola TaxID=34101 RepID=A0A927MT69_9BACL|nr:hypothetical protein [Sporosarcina limicola]MBE1556944.1 hypothetical protein [Sporosarcina limicola]
MDWGLMIVNVVGLFLLGLFIKKYLPAYMDQKGKNLATKEDIAEITRNTEEVKVLFQKEIALFSQELTFENDYAFNRYSILYARIYGIVIQSEYVRFFFKKHKIRELSLEEFPFIEINRTQIKQQRHPSTGEKLSEEIRFIDDEMTSFNKKELCDYIIKNSEYASPKLLKLAIAYRYAWSNYGGTKNIEGEKMSAAFNESEFELIKEIVKTIIVEYNEMRKIVNLSYSEHELTTGKLEHIEFK